MGIRTRLLNAARRLSHVFLPKEFYCPLCDSDVAGFFPIPRDFADEAKKNGYPYFGQGETINIGAYSCPVCGGSDRERLYALYIKDALAQFKAQNQGLPLKALHFAPERSYSKFLESTGIFDRTTTDYLVGNVDLKLDISHMPSVMDGAFDCFFCSHVLEHVGDDRAALKELYRILKPNGWGILMVPLLRDLPAIIEDPKATSEADRWRLFGQGDHVRLYNKSGFLERIKEAGFVIKELGKDYFGSDQFSKCGLTDTSTIYVAMRSQ